MKTKTTWMRGIGVALAALMLLASPIAPVRAASLEVIESARANGFDGSRYVAGTSTTGSGSVAMRLRWKGSGVASTVEINAAGDLIFTTDATTADTTLGLPTSNGTIDVSDATADTWGEVADEINGSGSNWECVLVDVKPSDSSNNVLWLMAETAVTTGVSATHAVDAKGIFDADGLALPIEIAQSDKLTIGIGVERVLGALYQPVGGTTTTLLQKKAKPSGSTLQWRSQVNYILTNVTYGTGASDVKVWLVQQTSSGTDAGATEQLMWSSAGAASTVNTTVDLTASPIIGSRGCRIVIENVGTAYTAGTLQVQGLVWRE